MVDRFAEGAPSLESRLASLAKALLSVIVCGHDPVRDSFMSKVCGAERAKRRCGSQIPTEPHARRKGRKNSAHHQRLAIGGAEMMLYRLLSVAKQPARFARW